MAKLANENWIYDDDNTAYAKKADDVLRKTKNSRIGRKFKYVLISEHPRTIIEVEDTDGNFIYGIKRKRS